MARRFRRKVRSNTDGTLTLNLSQQERELLHKVASELHASLQTGDDPSLRRLFPPSYADDPVREAGYQMMVGDELRQRQLDAAHLVTQTADAQVLDAAQAAAWLQAINAIRLVLGTRLKISDDAEPVRIERDDPDLASWIAYDFLSFLLNELVEALSI